MNPIAATALASILMVDSVRAEEPVAEVNEARGLLEKLSRGDSAGGPDAPRMGILSKWNMHVSTFEHSASVSDLKKLYADTCDRVDKLWSGRLAGRKFVSEFGFESHYAILELPSNENRIQRLVVALVQSNDSSTFYCATRDDDFDYSNHILKKSWHLSSPEIQQAGIE